MSADRLLKSLGTIVDLREREVDRLSADVAARRAVRERYVNNIARLEELYRGSGATGAKTHGATDASLSPEASLNCGSYKQAVMKMADAQREDLALHDADLAVAQRALTTATLRCEAMRLALERRRTGLRRLADKKEQKRQDEVASQAWRRGGR